MKLLYPSGFLFAVATSRYMSWHTERRAVYNFCPQENNHPFPRFRCFNECPNCEIYFLEQEDCGTGNWCSYHEYEDKAEAEACRQSSKSESFRRRRGFRMVRYIVSCFQQAVILLLPRMLRLPLPPKHLYKPTTPPVLWITSCLYAPCLTTSEEFGLSRFSLWECTPREQSVNAQYSPYILSAVNTYCSSLMIVWDGTICMI